MPAAQASERALTDLSDPVARPAIAEGPVWQCPLRAPDDLSRRRGWLLLATRAQSEVALVEQGKGGSTEQEAARSDDALHKPQT